ncbi:MAG TPA: undecaprenyldiphospho-muramoylpentapeptide beta-N-acetylglucosaminyltransferase [Deltaproteobacteria bacterium]|nr:undecaprenyldiphospho-muramoylpentapeptide beta-N-acetylglucosaminyltransferase [Deltaproteobacteria bacterium]
MTKRWIIAGGGTGGHVTPALALGEAIAERGDEILFVGSSHGLESRLVPEAGFRLELMPSEQFMGRNLPGRLRGGVSILRSVGTARGILRRFRADAVLSVGGYAAMPTALAAWMARCPLFLVEPNAIPGRVNRLTARLARIVFVGFEATRDALPSGTRSVCLGVPLRRALRRAFAGERKTELPGSPLRILVFGGSQGSRQLNEVVPEALSRLARNAVEVFHQTGEADRESVAKRYAELGIPAEITAFERDMPGRYAWADLAICRAGALTIAELALAGMPALLVPYPFAADDHQTANARALEEAGAARCLDPRPLDPTALAQAIAELIASPGRLVLMREAAARLARPDAANAIVEHCRTDLDPRSAGPVATPEEAPSCSND